MPSSPSRPPEAALPWVLPAFAPPSRRNSGFWIARILAENRLKSYRTARSAFSAVVLDPAGSCRKSGKNAFEWRDSRACAVGSLKVPEAQPRGRPGKSCRGSEAVSVVSGGVSGNLRVDIDFEGETVRWRAEHDKTGYEHTTPLAPAALSALEEAWRKNPGSGDAPILPAPKNPPARMSPAMAYEWWSRTDGLADWSREPKPGRGAGTRSGGSSRAT